MQRVTGSDFGVRSSFASFLAALLFAFAANHVCAQTVDAVPRIALPGHVLSVLPTAKHLAGSDDPSTPITLTVVLRRTDEAGFQQFLLDVGNPASPRYRKFLTPQELADRFGPSESDYRAVETWFEQQGFAVSDRYANRQTMTLTGSFQQAEHALAVRISDYEAGGTRFFANDRDPALPAAIADKVGSIAGLSNLARPRPNRMAIFFVVCANIAQFTQYFYHDRPS